ncbi:GNAT family N-acetyltransferase [Modestobacter sp. L9-4]|jgi:RimJ/RimL family protein N-acetyltransferase|uniref:GNAT family N-acetyltransferase n=1 Tax=Modestobacter sp. L9-4 TaxID=2851567 RepID=UPI001C76D546|nr:GNAT family protein [Modestobacter sp. L9-4]QXG75074.1 GNAT family N-acetyltransferase [Modestobacter sp. L9-4]
MSPAVTTDPVLRGEFVNLRPLQVADAELTFRWRSAARARFLNAGAQTVEQQADWIAARPDSERNHVIELADGRPVGMLSLTGVDPVNRHGEPGRFLIGDEAAVRGVPAAVEAMKLLYGLAFDELGLVRVHGIVAAGNTPMIRWQKFLGMQVEGRLRDHLYLDGRFQDAVALGLLVADYRTTTLPRMNVLIHAARSR